LEGEPSCLCRLTRTALSSRAQHGFAFPHARSQRCSVQLLVVALAVEHFVDEHLAKLFGTSPADVEVMVLGVEERRRDVVVETDERFGGTFTRTVATRRTSSRMVRTPGMSILAKSIRALVLVAGAACAAAPSSNTAAKASTPAATETAADACPAPKVTKDACAAVMVYVKVGGSCCAYADPCVAADGPRFNDAKCVDPSH